MKLPDRLRMAQLAIFSLALLSVIAGLWPASDLSQRPLPLGVANAERVTPGGFLQGALPPRLDRTGMPAAIPLAGSYVGGELFTGTFEGLWFRASARVTLALAGYPGVAGNSLELEVLAKDGTSSRIRYQGADPGETALPWTVELPANAESVRVFARDGSAAAHGWLAFSDPWQAAPLGAGSLLWAWLQLLAATCLAVTLLWGPGLLWLRGRSNDAGNFGLASLLGPVLLVALGLLTWLGGAWLAPSTVARVGALAILAWLGAREWRHSSVAALSAQARTVLSVTLLLVGFAVATANVSYGPKGELYGGSISRTMEVGGHSDSRISYCVVQVVANHLAPFEPSAAALFAPYSFASRGPLAGLIAAPVVLASGGKPVLGNPDQSWSPFDPEGFAVYRIALIVLTSLAGWTVFGVTSAVSSASWGLLAASILLFSPFYVHETYFTWPKLSAASCVLSAWLLARRSHALLAGAALAMGYLFHPLAILSAPAVLLWLTPRAVLQTKAEGVGGAVRSVLALAGSADFFLLGIAGLVLPWALLGKLAPPGADQSSFLDYFFMADILPRTLDNWLQVRWDNLAHTFIPFHLLRAEQSHATLNSIYGLSDGWVHFSYLYWNTLPFGLGLPAYLVVAPGLVVAVAKRPYVALSTFMGPLLILLLYWGITRTGYMRFAGQVLFLTSIVLAVWMLSQVRDRWSKLAVAWLVGIPCLTLRALDLLWMNFGRTWLNHLPQLEQRFGYNDLLSMSAAIALLTWAVLSAVRPLKSLQASLFMEA